MVAGRLMTLSRRNWKSRGTVRGLSKMPEKKPVIRYLHVFVEVEVAFVTCRSKENGVL